jgi:hypothetical protein
VIADVGSKDLYGIEINHHELQPVDIYLPQGQAFTLVERKWLEAGKLYILLFLLMLLPHFLLTILCHLSNSGLVRISNSCLIRTQ